jgi:putative ATPase
MVAYFMENSSIKDMEPLAVKLRPQSLAEYIGQEHLVGENKPLRLAIEEKKLFSFILWGPPGVGKTTLARIYAKSLDAELYELSAVSAGKDDIRKIVDDRSYSEKPKVLFLDEIHRFNKAQQDFLLPYVENGVITLIGATTENPSFEVISALLSRMRVFTLQELSPENMKEIIKRTGIKMKKDAIDWIIEMASGDARALITTLDTANQFYGKNSENLNANDLRLENGEQNEKNNKKVKSEKKGGKKITIENLKDTVQNRFLRFDKKGEEHYNTISAFIKSMRAGDADASVYYLARMLEAGEDPKFIARRMIIFASEDIGLVQPTALVVANDVFRAVEVIGMPEAAINLAHGVCYLALAKKDRRSYDALRSAQTDVKQFGNLPIPIHLRNSVTKLMKECGYGEGQQWTAGFKHEKGYLPDKLKKKKYLK